MLWSQPFQLLIIRVDTTDKKKLPTVLLFWVSLIGQNWFSVAAVVPLDNSGSSSFLLPITPPLPRPGPQKQASDLASTGLDMNLCASGPNPLALGPRVGSAEDTEAQEEPITTGRRWKAPKKLREHWAKCEDKNKNKALRSSEGVSSRASWELVSKETNTARIYQTA